MSKQNIISLYPAVYPQCATVKTEEKSIDFCYFKISR